MAGDIGLPKPPGAYNALAKTLPNLSITYSQISNPPSIPATSAEYVTLATDASLSGERVLTAGTNISIADAGAGSTVTVGITGQVALANGGTAANLTASNGGIFYSTASAGAVLSGTSTASKMLLSGASTAPTWSTSTIPTSAGATVGKHLASDGTNYVLTATTWPDTGTTGKVVVGNGTNYVESTPTLPVTSSATSGKAMISDGTNWVASTPTFPNASATSLKYIRSDGTNWIASTSTLPDSYTQGDVLYCSASNVLSALAKNTTATRYLANTGTTNNPAWDQVNLANGVTGTLTVPNGGSGVTSVTAYAPVVGGTTSTGALQAVSNVGASAGQVLTYQGTSSLPTWTTVSGGGGGAPVGSEYVILGTDATLTGYRTLTAGTNISIVDGGAAGAVTINATAPAGTANIAYYTFAGGV